MKLSAGCEHVVRCIVHAGQLIACAYKTEFQCGRITLYRALGTAGQYSQARCLGAASATAKHSVPHQHDYEACSLA
jgi:hypothetical protein